MVKHSETKSREIWSVVGHEEQAYGEIGKMQKILREKQKAAHGIQGSP